MLKLFAALTLSIILILPSIVYAQDTNDLVKQLNEKQAEIAKYQESLNSARKQESSLKNQLNIIDSQAKITQLKMDETKLRIEKLEREITDLSGRITRISSNVDHLSEVLLKRIVQTYKFTSNVNQIDLLFSSKGFSDFLQREKYIQVAQANDKKVLYQLQATKIAYNDQKQDRETRQTEAEALNKDLSKYQSQLDQSKKDKENLLKVTQNDEAKYQGLIAQIQAEINSISQAISNIGTKIGSVNKGQAIAAMGSTGCSTGPHLHFEVFENAKVEGGKITGNRTNPHNFLDNGKLGSPIQGYPDNITVTTEYGEVYRIFGFPSAHTGLDIAPKSYEGIGRPVLAAENGIAYLTSAPCSYNIAGGSSIGKGIIIDHQNGIVTLYWHIL